MPVLVGVSALALVALVFAGSFVVDALGSGSFSVEKAGETPASESVDGESEIPNAAPAMIVVHVGGAVVEPGVRELPEGARVQDAVDAAGGFAQGAACDALNLARVVADGEQVVVPTLADLETAAAEGPVSGSGSPALGAPLGGKVNINTASADQLDALPGVGPSTAQKIVADREANGPFVSPEDLKRVSGIGDKKFAALADSICVG